MARQLARGMGSFFKDCGCAKPTRCPHPYSIRFRDALGKQREESGYATQDDAMTTAPSVAAARRELGQLTVEEYAKQWRPRQRTMTDYSTGEHVDSSINVHIVPRLGSRKLNSVTPMPGRDGERRSRPRKPAEHIPDPQDHPARRLHQGSHGGRPGEGRPGTRIRTGSSCHPVSRLRDASADTVAGEDLALEIVMMAGCGLRNGEARAVNVNNVVAQDVYRVREQIHSNTLKPAKLKHRKAGEFREVPLPRSVREAIERYAEKHGTTKDGYLLRGPSGYYTEPMERRRVRKLFADLPPEEGVGMYGFRHYFASNALGNGIPITDVAEWMGHKSIEETYRTYRHLMPGSITKAARILDAGLWEAA
ncbi:site-specific integrase [Streptomyces sp. NBC_00233]|uniref:tyrosine-type recombinase/integrase n=1 Tax=Streptomyces sp. NBC_00233 TaxID=2975686 RepID=UPI00225A4008|nr:site-specific integrase [Streptomyces sp. NBC_00233]MCX5230296.1 site-specific integrase [Streptomyces sp. NBC_00233]